MISKPSVLLPSSSSLGLERWDGVFETVLLLLRVAEAVAGADEGVECSLYTLSDRRRSDTRKLEVMLGCTVEVGVYNKSVSH